MNDEEKAEFSGQLAVPDDIADTIEFVHPDHLNVAEYKRTMIVYWAPWSGPFVGIWKLLTRKLLEEPNPVQVILIHSDHWRNPVCGTLFGPEIGGWAEICWIQNGKIIGRDVYAKPEKSRDEVLSRIDERLRQLDNGCL